MRPGGANTSYFLLDADKVDHHVRPKSQLLKFEKMSD
jgi:hypothetical protein